MSELVTLMELELRSGINRTRLAYAAYRYHIEPTQRAGLVKLYNHDQAKAIVSAANRVGERRGINA